MILEDKSLKLVIRKAQWMGKETASSIEPEVDIKQAESENKAALSLLEDENLIDIICLDFKEIGFVDEGTCTDIYLPKK